MASGISFQTEKELATRVASFAYDFYGFIMFAYPWGVKGTPLERHSEGPETWQRELAMAISEHAAKNQVLRFSDIDMTPWRSARASGHGVGKSAFVAWMVQWVMSTRPNARGTVTANTGNQLETRTWPELAKWHSMLINRHWFQWTASSYYFAQYPEDRRKNYMITAATVSPENTEAFAGLHNEDSAVLLIFDEASGIDAKVFEVAEGALTDGEAFFLLFGNPTRPDGPFYDCFNKHSALYDIGYIDSREVRHTNKTAIAQMIQKFGADSDEVKYRVYGQFPSRSYSGYLIPAKVDEAMHREVFTDMGAPLVLGVDVARYGDDETVLCPRRGRDARSLPWQVYKGLDGKAVAELVAEWANRYKPDAIVIESVGPGLVVISYLRDWKYRVIEVHPGVLSQNRAHVNVRMDLWSKLHDGLENSLCLPEDVELYKQLVNINYVIDEGTQKMRMEKKADMKSRGQPSPDKADALVLTYAVTLPRRDASTSQVARHNALAITDYDEFAR